MKVLIDCTQITRNKAGVGVYAYNTIREVTKIPTEMTCYLLVQDDDPDWTNCRQENVRLIPVKSGLFRLIPLRFLLEQVYIPYLVFKLGIDVVHSLHYSFPLFETRARTVVTVHDMTAFLMPQVHIPAKMRYYKFFIRALSRRRDDLIFVSRSTLEDYHRLFPETASSDHVIPLGKSSSFRPDLDPAMVQKTIAKYGINVPYLLFLGMIEPRKNLIRLVEAFSTLSQRFPGHSLVIAGMKGWMYDDLFALVKNRGLEGRVNFAGFIDEEDKPYLLRGATVFVYPSLYEGFGIPVLEALSCGTPTLTSNISAMPEIAGDAALLVDPTSVDEIAHGLESLMQDEWLRAELSARSVRQAARFEWSKTAAETVEVYRKAMSGRS